MKKLLLFSLLATAGFTVKSQTTATDFTALDCNAVSHNLFTELNAGKVVVMVWVMPCSACEGPAKAAYNAVQTFASSHPGKVLYYLIDDYGDDPCPTLSGWVNSASIGNAANMAIFENAGNTIKMSDYGSNGMPKVVVAGGAGHTIYFNKNNNLADDEPGITAAINDALNPTGIREITNEIRFSVAPNPAGSEIAIGYEAPVRTVVITTIGGQVVKENVFTNGLLNPVISLGDLAKGIYLVRVADIDNRQGVGKFIRE